MVKARIGNLIQLFITSLNPKRKRVKKVKMVKKKRMMMRSSTMIKGT